jgi:hypothetical protein
VHEFLGSTEVTAALGPVTKHVEALGRTIDRLSVHAVEQDASDRAFRAGSGAARRQAQRVRGEFMRPVSQMGKSLFPSDASLRQALAMPRVTDYQGVIAASLAMAERAEEHKDRFVSAGFSDDFVVRFRKAVDDLRAALDDKAAHYGRRAAATAGMLDELARGRQLVKMLDAMVAPALGDAPDQLAQWRTLARFVRVTPVEEESPAPAPAVPPNVLTVVTPNVVSAIASDVPEERAA